MAPRLRSSAFALMLVLGCKADEGDPPLIVGACGEIVDACHTKDDGTPGQINDCHGVAHDENEQECSNIHAMCIEVCNAAPTVHDTDSYGETEDHGESDDHGESTDPGTTTDHGESTDPEPTSSTGATTDASTSSTGDATTSGTTADEPSCAELGAGCHDTPTPLGEMCHDVGHDEDETACAEIWAECKAECGF